jgi:signal transduction histidine kinase/DNA-binding NarL/FixJ family response regulator
VHVSQQKWGETLQASQASRAQESKRQLENFIDTTSHEMRNPLSAIVQCADSIISSHKTLERSTDHQDIYRSISDITVDAAETIVQCSKHMKNIVDDVLTMSKLDSGLFIMTPVDVQLESIARSAVKMFEGEAKSAGVDLHFCLEESYKEAHINNVSLDPTRVLQILINLLTNAIKFTSLEETRRICVSLGVSLEPPSRNGDGRVTFLRMSEATEAKSLLADWEKGEIVYVIFSVQDTGRGLSDAEHKLLFARFSQASPRTHIDYGGSGLGLFISRCLSEMHGGAIGFASTSGVGSTFSFYVKTRKSKPPRLGRNGSIVAVDPSVPIEQNLPNKRYGDQRIITPIPSSIPLGKEVANSDLHILVVEDNLVNQRVLAKQLRNLGMNVTVANHGGEALEHLRSTNYCIGDARRTTDSLDATNTPANTLSLILMDWEMPVMDGLTCVRNIRQLQREGIVHGHVPVIAVTANVRSEQVTVALEAGMDEVISKPFRIPELCACIRKVLNNTKNI